MLNGGKAGIEAGELISWDNTRSIVIDLGKIQPVDKVDLQTAQAPGPNHNGTMNSIKVYAKVNESDDWTYVRDITPGTESFMHPMHFAQRTLRYIDFHHADCYDK